ncbi:MAG TPA: DUF6518 family protein [Clostridia bacterium]|nr:DUF6518 family protein [Clostridia bacterium]
MPSSRPRWSLILLVVLAGLGTGALTQVGQSVLPTGWSQAANAISPWLLVAFLVGSVMPGRTAAGAAGTATLVLALVGYYTMTQLRYGIGGGTGALVFWGIGAAVGGPVFGLAGRVWAGAPQVGRAVALGLLTAAAIAEGGYHAVVLDEPPVAAGFVVGGLLVPIVLGRSGRDRVGAYVAAVPALVLGAIGFATFLWLNGVTAGLS